MCASPGFQDQYKFVYDTLEEHAICGPSWFPVKELSQRLRAKGQRGTSKLSEYQREYQVAGSAILTHVAYGTEPQVTRTSREMRF